jgi:hypothetical protein
MCDSDAITTCIHFSHPSKTPKQRIVFFSGKITMKCSELIARLNILGWCQLLLILCILLLFVYLAVLDADVQMLSCQVFQLSRKFAALP